jgi:deazaflavin-dependent oxidoreductase (nitroreductase family)
LVLVWGIWRIAPGAWPGIVSPIAQTVVYLAITALTAYSRRAKVSLVRCVQRFTINPLMRVCLWIGVNPLGVVILETRGRVSGRARRTPVGNGRTRDTLWIIAEHGTRSNYVRNIERDPHVRVRLRLGLRYRWVDGVAIVRRDDDTLARQRQIIRWHPLRALNASVVRVLGADLLTVEVKLALPHARTAPAGDARSDAGPISVRSDGNAYADARAAVTAAVTRSTGHRL